MISPEFLISSLIVVLVPGTGVLCTVSWGLAQGRRASVFAGLGCTAGILPHLAAAVLGLAAIMHTSAMAFQTLKFAGVLYLFSIAWATWRDTSTISVDARAPGTSAAGVVTHAFLLNILNPKLTIFFLAFLPQFVDPAAERPLLHLLALGAGFMAITVGVFVVCGWLADAFRALVIASPRVQERLRQAFAAAFAGLGARRALAESST